MAERSWFWGGTTTGDAALAPPYGAPYSDDMFSDVFTALFCRDNALQGVVNTSRSPYHTKLSLANGGVDQIVCNPGMALVDGKLYSSDASVTHNLTRPGSGLNYYYLVLRKSWANQTVRQVLLGPDAGGYPVGSVLRVDDTTWDLIIGSFTISNTGTRSITTHSTNTPTMMLHHATNISSDMIDPGAVTSAAMANRGAISVMGRISSVGVPEDITAGTDGHVLRRAGSSLGFGTIATAGLADNVLSATSTGRAKMQDGFLSADATGRAKMAASFFSADATGRGKFANQFVNADLLAAGAVSNRQRIAATCMQSGTFTVRMDLVGTATGSGSIVFGTAFPNPPIVTLTGTCDGSVVYYTYMNLGAVTTTGFTYRYQASGGHTWHYCHWIALAT